MNILILNWRDKNHPRAGGAEVRLHEIYERMSARHTIHLFSTRFKNSAKYEFLDGIHIHRLGQDWNFNWLCAFFLKQWIQKYNIDLVVEDFNKLPFFTPWITSKPQLIQMHHLWKYSIFKEASFPIALFVWLHEQTLRWIYKKSSFCVVSPSTQIELEGYGINPTQIEVIYNGVDLNFYTPPKDRNNKKTKQFIWLGRLQKYKGIMDVLKAFQKLIPEFPDLQLKIAGNGPFKEEIAQFIHNNQLENHIHLLGFISQDEKKHLLQESVALIQSSYKEGWGLTVIEANACGTSVIGNNAPGLCDSIQDKKTGLLYHFADQNSLEEKMRYYLQHNDSVIHFEENAKDWAQNFTWEKASLQTEELLKRLCV